MFIISDRLLYIDGLKGNEDNKEDDKFFVLDECQLEIGDEFRVGPNGYFEKIGNPTKLMTNFVKEELTQ